MEKLLSSQSPQIRTSVFYAPPNWEKIEIIFFLMIYA